MKTRIIVEGADQQGKTEVCNMLKEILGKDWNIVHFNLPPERFDFFSGYMLDEKTISDRSFISEIVYSTLKDNQSRIPHYRAKELLEYAREKTIVLYIDRSTHFVFDSTRNEVYSESEILRARQIYRNIIPFLDLEVMYVNPCIAGAKQFLNYIVSTRILGVEV